MMVTIVCTSSICGSWYYSATSVPPTASSSTVSPSVPSIIPESTISTTFSVAYPSAAIKALSNCCSLIISLESPDKLYSLDCMLKNVLSSKIFF
jgi:hypothetical protein